MNDKKTAAVRSKEYRDRIRQDPELFAKYKEKERIRHLPKTGKKEFSEEKKRELRQKWAESKRKQRSRSKTLDEGSSATIQDAPPPEAVVEVDSTSEDIVLSSSLTESTQQREMAMETDAPDSQLVISFEQTIQLLEETNVLLEYVNSENLAEVNFENLPAHEVQECHLGDKDFSMDVNHANSQNLDELVSFGPSPAHESPLQDCTYEMLSCCSQKSTTEYNDYSKDMQHDDSYANTESQCHSETLFPCETEQRLQTFVDLVPISERISTNSCEGTDTRTTNDCGSARPSRKRRKKMFTDFILDSDPPTKKSKIPSCQQAAASLVPSPKKAEPSRQKIQGRKAKHRHTSKLYRALKKAEREKEAMSKERDDALRQAKMYRKRHQRLLEKREDKSDPQVKIKKIIRRRIIPKDIQERLVAAESLVQDYKEAYNSIKSIHVRSKFAESFHGKKLRKYKLLKKYQDAIPFKKKIKRNSRKSRMNPQAKQRKARELIKQFWLSDFASRECPDKRKFFKCPKTREKVQLRFMNGTRKGLFRYFQRTLKSPIFTYSSFCRHKPGWVVPAKLTDRNTCLCVLCANVDFKVKKLHTLKISPHLKAIDLCQSICCVPFTVLCLLRECENCKTKTMGFNKFIDHPLQYQTWEKIKEHRISAKSKKSIVVQRTVLLAKKSSAEKLVKIVEKDIIEFMKHTGRDYHQKNQFQEMQNNLEADEMMMRIDFSENYACKYAEGEAHAVHFGASRDQICLHTGVAYWQGGLRSFCTCSASLRHDAYAAVAHIKPILQDLLSEFPAVKKLHIISDSPTAQYRNQTMFGLLLHYLPSQFPTLDRITWHYSEAGHGKSAADGVGGTIKRTADRMVADGTHMDSFNSFISALSQYEDLKKITIKTITEADILEIETSGCKSVSFLGTMKTHQVSYDRENINTLTFNRLTCISCHPTKICQHFSLGSAPTQKQKRLPSARTPKKKPSPAQNPKKKSAPAPTPKKKPSKKQK